jgi:Cof subfamily protein (haloacid dehalogenase superfamily)
VARMTDEPWANAPLDIRLVVADMDGTLLDGEGNIPESFWPMLRRMHDRGIVFAPASGRQYATLAHLFDRAIDGMVIISENGAFVVRDGVELFSEVLDRQVIESLVLRLRSLVGLDFGVVLSGKRSAYVERSDPRFMAEALKYHVALEIVDDLLLVDDDIVKVAIIDFDDAETSTAPHLAQFRETHQVVISGAHAIDVIAANVNKGEALERLQRQLGITRDQTVVFGDYLNDIEMLDAAGLSFAMADAHPEVLKHARYRAPSNRDHGVVDILDRLIPA